MTDTPELELDLDGKTYRLRAGSFTGEDDLLLYQKTGLTVLDVFMGKVTLFSLAGLVWLERRRTEPDLTYEQVNRSMTFDTLNTVRDADGESPGPEA